MDTITYRYEQLERFCSDAFVRFGFTPEQAAQITDVLLLADLYGITSHGTHRLARYRNSILRGSVHVDAQPEVVFETPVSAVIDGHHGMGQLTSVFATNLAIEKAKKVGMAFVTVRNSNHYGIAGYYAKMACDQGLIGISATNTESLVVHTHAREPILGTNPIAMAMPADPYPFWFDAATSVVSRGKLEVYNKLDKPLEREWAVDENGDVCTDAAHVLNCFINEVGAGGILPVGGSTEEMGSHKGYGYAMMAELFTAILSGGLTSNHHRRRVQGQGSGSCHAFIVVDPAIFGDPAAIRAHLSAFLQELRNAKRADESVPIYTHGEKEMLCCARRMREGIPLNIATVAEMIETGKALGMDTAAYFGAVDTSGAKLFNYEKKAANP